MSGDISTPATGMTGAGGGDLIRLTGMATGLDVDAMVKKMMKPEQIKLDRAKQNQQTIQWKQEAYQDIIKDIKDLQSNFFDFTSSDKNILSAANFAPYTVSGADTSIATFTPGVGAKAGKYSIEVKQLAKGAGITNKLSGKSLSTKLTEIDPSLKESINLTLSVNGAPDINVNLDNTSDTATIGDLVNAINDQGSGSVKAAYSELTGEFSLNSAKTGSDTSLTIGKGTTASLSNILGFSTSNGEGLTTADWTINTSNTPATIAGATASKGQNADVTITPPGSSIGTPVIDKTSNNFTIDGMTYTLSSIGDSSVNVGLDTDKVYDKIKGFIDKYNAIMDKIQTKLTEKPDHNYKPLTDSQKSGMSASDITNWEAKAKQGILRNDDNLQNMLNDLRSAFNTSVSNTGLSLGKYGSNSIGIDISADYKKPAHVDILDAAKLKEAISSKSDQILKIFTNVSTTAAETTSDGSKKYDPSTQEYKEDGIFTRIKSILEKNVGNTNVTLNSSILTSYANKQYDYSTTGTGGKNTLPDQIYEQQLAIGKITDEMSTKQEKYYQQFSKLETAMNTLNAQQSQLSYMLGQ